MKTLSQNKQNFKNSILNNQSNIIKAIWSESLTKDPNDCTIIVTGTTDERVAIDTAKELFKKDVTDKNGCVAYRWGSNTYLNEFPDTVFVYMADVG